LHFIVFHSKYLQEIILKGEYYLYGGIRNIAFSVQKRKRPTWNSKQSVFFTTKHHRSFSIDVKKSAMYDCRGTGKAITSAKKGLPPETTICASAALYTIDYI